MNRLNVGGCVNIFPEGRVLPVVPLGMDRVLPTAQPQEEDRDCHLGPKLRPVSGAVESSNGPLSTCCPRSSPTWETG